MATFYFRADDPEAEHVFERLLELFGHTAVHAPGPWSGARAARRFRLTEREIEVVEAFVRGGTNAEIAEAMGIKAPTVKWHFHNILGKTGSTTREQLLRKLLLDEGRAQ